MARTTLTGKARKASNALYAWSPWFMTIFKLFISGTCSVRIACVGVAYSRFLLGILLLFDSYPPRIGPYPLIFKRHGYSLTLYYLCLTKFQV